MHQLPRTANQNLEEKLTRKWHYYSQQVYASSQHEMSQVYG